MSIANWQYQLCSKATLLLYQPPREPSQTQGYGYGEPAHSKGDLVQAIHGPTGVHQDRSQKNYPPILRGEYSFLEQNQPIKSAHQKMAKTSVENLFH